MADKVDGQEIGQGSKSLGSWFPNASVRKTKALGKDDKCSLLLFYHYVNPVMSEGRKDHLKKFLDDVTSELGLGGRLRVAREVRMLPLVANILRYRPSIPSFTNNLH
jgi:hypothetical protein